MYGTLMDDHVYNMSVCLSVCVCVGVWVCAGAVAHSGQCPQVHCVHAQQCDNSLVE